MSFARIAKKVFMSVPVRSCWGGWNVRIVMAVPAWTVCFLLAILVVILPDDHAFAALIVYLLILFILFYLFLPFWVRNHLMKIQPVTKKQD